MEFDLIKKWFQPLSGPGSEGLEDDCAYLSLATSSRHPYDLSFESGPLEHKLVTSTDMMVEGVHFPQSADASLIARRALSCAISDLAASGACALGYQMAIAFPEKPSDSWLKNFTEGLREIQDKFCCPLLGGDTTRSFKGTPLVISMTVYGQTPKPVLRKGAKSGDFLYVSGFLGDAAAGLSLILDPGVTPANNLSPEVVSEYKNKLLDAYHYPPARLDLRHIIRRFASAAIDISDGFVADLSHLATASKVGVEVDYDRLPVSPALSFFQPDSLKRRDLVLAGGDDYQLLFTVSPDDKLILDIFINQTERNIMCIGHVTQDHRQVKIKQESGLIDLSDFKGYDHFG